MACNTRDLVRASVTALDEWDRSYYLSSYKDGNTIEFTKEKDIPPSKPTRGLILRSMPAFGGSPMIEFMEDNGDNTSKSLASFVCLSGKVDLVLKIFSHYPLTSKDSLGLSFQEKEDRILKRINETFKSKGRRESLLEDRHIYQFNLDGGEHGCTEILLASHLKEQILYIQEEGYGALYIPIMEYDWDSIEEWLHLFQLFLYFSHAEKQV